MHVVVVAEDEILIRMAAAQALSDEGFIVWEAEDAEEALNILEAEAEGVHILFTDIRMSGAMDGVALSHHVNTHWPWIGLLVTSAHPDVTEADLPAGSRFVPKPYHHDHVIGHIRKLVEATL